MTLYDRILADAMRWRGTRTDPVVREPSQDVVHERTQWFTNGQLEHCLAKAEQLGQGFYYVTPEERAQLATIPLSAVGVRVSASSWLDDAPVGTPVG